MPAMCNSGSFRSYSLMVNQSLDGCNKYAIYFFLFEIKCSTHKLSYEKPISLYISLQQHKTEDDERKGKMIVLYHYGITGLL